MEYRRFHSKIIARLDKGEEIIEMLTNLCEKEAVSLASVSAIGAVGEATVGYYNTVNKKYFTKDFIGILEIANLSGTVSTLDNEVYLHLHCVLSDDTHQTVGGHLNRAVVSATCEIVLEVIDGKVDRQFSDEVGLNLFEF